MDFSLGLKILDSPNKTEQQNNYNDLYENQK